MALLSRQSFAFLVLVLSAASGVAEDGPSTPEMAKLSPTLISAGVEQQQQRYLDTCFKYEATIQIEGARTSSSTEIFAMLRSDDAGELAPWRKWQKFTTRAQLDREELLALPRDAAGTPAPLELGELQKMPMREAQRDESELLVDYLAFNGSEFARFTRERNARGQTRPVATVWPTEQVDHYEQNIFDKVLTTDLLGVARYFDHERTFYKENFEGSGIKVSEIASNRVSDRDVVLLEFSSQQLGIDYTVGVALPEFIVVEYVAHKRGDPAERFLAYDVNEIGSDSVGAFPLRGSYYQSAASGADPLEYTFAVTEVRRLDASEHRDDWLPEWPPGSSGYDLVRDVNIKVPASPEELSEKKPRSLGAH